MKHFFKTLPSSIAHNILTRLGRSARGRRLIERLICDAQACLGIGTGFDVNSSGERVIFETLQKTSCSSSSPLCIFDVGANQGQFFELTERSLAKTLHKVHCFEPSPSTFAILEKNVGDRSNIILNPFGLGAASGEYDLFSNKAGSGLASLSKRRLDHFGIEFNRKERVQIQTLDSYCEGHDIAHIDLLKLDVEGHELEVLKGATRMFNERRIRMVTFEFGGCNIDSRTFVQDFHYFFNSHGMSSIFRILPSGRLAKIKSYSETLEQFRTTNFLVLSTE